MDHKGRHSRGYLPHCDFPDSVQAITFRLADSVPKHVLEEWRKTAAEVKGDPKAESEIRRRIARFEDEGRGECLLRSPSLGGIVQQQLLAGHEIRYRLIEWCVMPNHVHVLISMQRSSLSKIVQTWKGASTMGINRQMRRSGTLWMPDYHDRFIRDMDHFHDTRLYIRCNPVKALLCREPEEWPLSSAGVNWNPDEKPG